MKALIYNGQQGKELVEKPKPSLLKPTDAIIRITKTTICGTDLHILGGDVPAVTAGRTLGHEVSESLKKSDRPSTISNRGTKC